MEITRRRTSSSILKPCSSVDVGRLGMGDKYVDLALMYKSLAHGRNPQYGLIPAARSFVEQYGGDPDDPRIPYYIGLDDSDSFWERGALR
jgi:aminoglycoside phosphotransferase